MTRTYSQDSLDTKEDWGFFTDPDQSSDSQEMDDCDKQIKLTYNKSESNLFSRRINTQYDNDKKDDNDKNKAQQIISHWSWNETIIALSITSFFIVIIALNKQSKLLDNIIDKNEQNSNDHAKFL